MTTTSISEALCSTVSRARALEDGWLVDTEEQLGHALPDDFQQIWDLRRSFLDFMDVTSPSTAALTRTPADTEATFRQACAGLGCMRRKILDYLKAYRGSNGEVLVDGKGYGSIMAQVDGWCRKACSDYEAAMKVSKGQ